MWPMAYWWCFGISLLERWLASLSLHPSFYLYSVGLFCLAIFCLAIGRTSFIYQPVREIHIHRVQKDHPNRTAGQNGSFCSHIWYLSPWLRWWESTCWLRSQGLVQTVNVQLLCMTEHGVLVYVVNMLIPIIFLHTPYPTWPKLVPM